MRNASSDPAARPTSPTRSAGGAIEPIRISGRTSRRRSPTRGRLRIVDALEVRAERAVLVRANRSREEQRSRIEACSWTYTPSVFVADSELVVRAASSTAVCRFCAPGRKPVPCRAGDRSRFDVDVLRADVVLKPTLSVGSTIAVSLTFAVKLRCSSRLGREAVVRAGSRAFFDSVQA